MDTTYKYTLAQFMKMIHPVADSIVMTIIIHSKISGDKLIAQTALDPNCYKPLFSFF